MKLLLGNIMSCIQISSLAEECLVVIALLGFRTLYAFIITSRALL